jgi:upstream activation factor subunit UAF30
MPKSTESSKKTKKTTTSESKVVETKTEIKPEVTVLPTVVETETAPTISETNVVEGSEESNTEVLFNKLNNQFQDLLNAAKTMQNNLKILQKEILRERKDYKKKESKQKKKNDKKNEKRKPNGFAKPAVISDELANFLGVEKGSELARTEVTSKIISYVKEHNLQNPERKKEIVPDAKLSALLKPSTTDVITFFNLQTFLKTHFASNKTVTQSESVTVV